VNTNLYASWKDGIYIFDHETLGGLTERLERIFAVKIYIRNDDIRDYKFSGTISRNVPFEQILKIIQISAPIKYKLKETNGAIEKVELYRKNVN
jgi:transmembrane sensor